ncbi:MAG: PQQ-binding-like beta-propeller repeat protein [Alphaproteobacteria bacterium]|nr:PQQ-binding-like beta-propeller repeat protein [Alphaproteobacteria bacterium]
MSRAKNTILCVSMILALSGCSKVTDIFSSDDETRLEGKRISVLELQQSLKPDSNNRQLIAPDPWKSAYWPQAGGYPNHSMQNLALSKDLNRVWKTGIGSGGSGALPLTAQPVIAEGRIYTLDTDFSLRATDAQSGKLLWKTDIENEEEDDSVISGGIGYANNMLFITNGYNELLKVKAADGSIVWRKPLPAASRAAPTVLEGRIYVTTLDNRLVALSEETGDNLWTYVGIAETAGLLGAASPAANTSIVVAVFSSGEITALRPENGSVAWSDNMTSTRGYGGGLESLSDIRALPVLDHNLVITLGFGGKLIAFDETTGTRVWQREIGGSETPWVAGNFLFVLSNSQQLIALNIEDGGIVWITQLPRFENEKDRSGPITWKAPVMGSGRLILAGTDGQKIEVNAADGKSVKSWKDGKTPAVPPIIASNTLFVLSVDGTLAAYR